jgi:hypothetical protein
MSDDDVLIEFSMSKFATKQHRLDAMAEQIVTLREQLAEAKDWGEPVAWCWMDEEIGFGLPPDEVSQEATLLYAKKEEGK